MSESIHRSRREFLRRAVGAAGALALPVLLPARALGLDGTVAPSNRIHLGFIGLGGMGTASMRSLKDRAEVEIVALCDVDLDHLQAVKSELEQSLREQGRPREVATTQDFRELLARPDVDAVVISTPDHWHVLIASEAARAGKDIYCEKPLTLTVAEGWPLVAAIRRHGTVLQVGSWQRSKGTFRRAVELVRQGRLGTVSRIEVGLPGPGRVGFEAPQAPPAVLDYERWLGPAPWAPYTPGRVHYNFRWFYDYSGGMATDWGAHHLDIAQWALGCELSGPSLIHGTGEFQHQGLSDTPIGFDFHLLYDCSHGRVDLHCTTAYPNGLRFIGSEGELFISRDDLWTKPGHLLAAPLRQTLGEGAIGSGGDHYTNWLQCIRTRAVPEAPVEIAHRSSTACHLANIAMLTGRELKWDPKAERFIGDDPANRMLARASRSPWVQG